MSTRRSLRVSLLTLLFLMLGIVVPVSSSDSAAANPAAGSCSDSTGEWVCNVEGETLSFKTVGSTTQAASSGIGPNSFDPAAGTSIIYKDVFSDGTTTIDATLSVISKTNLDSVDSDRNEDLGTADSIIVDTGGTGETEFTVSFFERSSQQSARLLNVAIVIKDLDGGTQNEFAVFEGLSSYTTLSTTDILVSTDSTTTYPSTAPGTESPSPETGVRQFGAANGAITTDQAHYLYVTYDSVTQVGFFAGTRGSAGVIGFTFTNPAGTFSPGAATTTTAVGAGTYTVTYDEDAANGGSGTAPSAVSASGAITLSTGSGLTNSSTSIPISAWSTQPNGAGVKYTLGSSYTPVKNVTLYAVYEANTVTFNANGGSGVDYTQSASGPTSLTTNTFTRSGYTFSAWNTSADGTGASYANGASFPFAADDTLYAQWQLPSASSGSGSQSSGHNSTPGIFLTVTSKAGDSFSGSSVIYGSYAILSFSPYQVTLQSISDPTEFNRVLASGRTDRGGHLERTLSLPRVEAGNYKIILTGTGSNGETLKLTNHVNVDSSGRFTSVSAERLQPLLP